MRAYSLLKSPNKFKITLGLDRIGKILDSFSNPENSFSSVHIAGTNGKGSTASILEAVLIEDKKEIVGKYTSPHIFSYTERIKVNGENISEKDFERLTELVFEREAELKISLTEFEILTVVAFLYFKEKNVTLAILETGLGGRLDATNVIKKPLISIITSISYDHKELLGDTIEEISYEKAGIIKNGAKALFLKENKGYKTLLDAAEKNGAKIINDDLKISVEGGFAFINDEKIPFSLSGDYQAENLKLAYLASLELGINGKTVKKALSKVKWPFRTELKEFEGKQVLIDSCHNPDGARVFAEYLKKYYRDKKIKFIFGCLKNKDYNSILDILYDNSYDFCFYEFNYPNSLTYGELNNEKLRKIENPIEEIKKGDFDLCAVGGSIYMLGDIFKNVF